MIINSYLTIITKELAPQSKQEKPDTQKAMHTTKQHL